MNFTIKTVALVIIILTNSSYGQEHFESTIIEMYKGKKFKAIFGGTQMSVHEILKTNKDTTYYTVTTGEFILITKSDSLILKPTQIQTYYLLTNSVKPVIISMTDKNLPVKSMVGQVNLSKIQIGRKTYKFKSTKENEQVWAYGDPW